MKMQIRTFKNLMFASVLLTMAACSTPAEQPVALDLEKIRVEIQAMEDAYAAGEAAKDANAVTAYYSDDAVSHARNMEPAVGKAAITERIAGRIAADTTGNSNVYKIVDLYAAGDMVVEIGSWTEMSPDGNKVDWGYYMSYFEKRDGKYLCVRDMSLSSKPSEQPAVEEPAADQPVAQ